MIKAELKKFKTEQGKSYFCKSIFKQHKRQYVLIIGTKPFINNLMDNIQETDLDYFVTEDYLKYNEIKCNYCLIEEDYIKKLNQYKKYINKAIYILSVIENTNRILNNSNDIKNDNNKDNIYDDTNISILDKETAPINDLDVLTTQYEKVANDAIDKFLNVSYYVTDEDKKKELLLSLFGEGYNLGVTLDRLSIAQGLIDEVTYIDGEEY